MSRNLTIIPTYNEKENILLVIEKVLSLGVKTDILIVDDGSPDGTADIVKDRQKDTPELHIMERAGKLGLGTAYIAGFKYAIEHKYDTVVQMDGDFSHDPEVIETFLKEIETNDINVRVSAINPSGEPTLHLFNSGKIIDTLDIKELV